MLPIQHAARALGVPDEQLRRLAEQGTIPEAVNREGEWLVPTMALVSIARQRGWALDLATLQQQLDFESPGRYPEDALAAQAAVLLARTQATAARVESRDLLRRLREATDAASAARAAHLEVSAALTASEQQLEEIKRRHAVAQAKLAELRKQVGDENRQFQFMVDRINSLEQDRRRLSLSLGWLGKLRYRRLADRMMSASQQPMGSRLEELADDVPTDGPGAEAVAPERAPVDDSFPPLVELTTPDPPTVSLSDPRPPVWEVASDEPLWPEPQAGDRPSSAPTEPATERAVPVPPVSIRSASTMAAPEPRPHGPGQPDTVWAEAVEGEDVPMPGTAPRPSLHASVSRTPDGRFGQSSGATRPARRIPAG